MLSNHSNPNAYAKNLIFSSVFTIIAVWFALQIDFVTIAYLKQNLTSQSYDFWRVVSDYGDGSIYFIIAFIGLMIGYWGQFFSSYKARKIFEFSFTSLAALISAGVVVRLIKWGMGRPRPKVWIEENMIDLSPFSMMSEFNAFPSGHTQTAFTVAFLLTLLMPRYRMVFFLLASFVGASRIALLNHWPSDVIVGAFIGVLIPCLTTLACQKFFKGEGISFLRPRQILYNY